MPRTPGSLSPRSVLVSMKPGYTDPPFASITLAPAGTGTSAPTAAILLPRMTIVPRSTVGFATDTIRALVIARTSFVADPGGVGTCGDGDPCGACAAAA